MCVCVGPHATVSVSVLGVWAHPLPSSARRGEHFAGVHPWPGWGSAESIRAQLDTRSTEGRHRHKLDDMSGKPSQDTKHCVIYKQK